MTASSPAFTKEDYEKASALDMAAAVRSGRVTSEQLITWAYEEIKVKDEQLNAMISLRIEAALKEAQQLQDNGQPFLGVPVLIKGLHAVKGSEQTHGLSFMKGNQSTQHSKYTKALIDAGFIVIGQTNFPELGLKNISDSPLYGKVANGLDPLYHAGGSSGGSAAGLAAHYAPVASASDAGGSIRIPAAWNGLIGFKPSPGLLYGEWPNPQSPVVHFPLTKYMKDTIALFAIFGGFRALSTNNSSSKSLLPSSTANKRSDLQSPLPQLIPQQIRIAYTSHSPIASPVSPEAKAALATIVSFLKTQGFQVEEKEVPLDGLSLIQDYYTVTAEISASIDYLSQRHLTRPIQVTNLHATTWGLYAYGQHLTRDDLDQAWTRIQRQAKVMTTFHQTYDLYLTPTTAFPAPLLSENFLKPDHLIRLTNNQHLTKEGHAQLVYDQWLDALTYTPFTQMANLFGAPAISLPTYVTADGRTMGVQFQAAPTCDALLLSMGQFLEDHQQFHTQKPL